MAVGKINRGSLWSAKRQLQAAWLGCSLLPFVLVAVLNNNVIRPSLTDTEVRKISALNTELSRGIIQEMDRAVEALRLLGTNPYLKNRQSTSGERLEEMRRLVRVYDIFSDISLYNEDGDIINSTTFSQDQVHDRTIWFERAVRGETLISSPRVVRGLEGLHLSVYHRLENADGQPQVIRGRIPFDAVWQKLDQVELGKGGYAFLLDARGNVISHRNHERIYTKVEGPFRPETIMRQAPDTGTSSGKSTLPTLEDPTHASKFFYAARIIGSDRTRVGEPWVLVSCLPKAEVQASFFAVARVILVTAGAFSIVVFFAGSALSRSVLNPLTNAAAAAGRVAEDDLEIRIPERGPNEIRALASAFNSMVGEVRRHRDELELQVANRTRRLRESEANLRIAAAQLRAAYDSIQEGILVIGHDEEVITSNARMTTLFPENSPSGRDATGRSLPDQLADRFAEPRLFRELWAASAREENRIESIELSLADHEDGVFEIFTAPVRQTEGDILARLWMFRDLTEQRSLERSLQQAQKMEAIGRLAGGVAHDFNNLLTGIIGNLSLALLECQDLEDDELETRVTSARSAAQRGAELVKGLLGFSRCSHLEIRPLVLNAVIDEVCGLIRATIDPRIELEPELNPELWMSNADPTQIEQVIMNMCVNASHAMPDGGVIRLRTRNLLVSPAEAKGNEDAAPGEFVCIEVEDNGTGMEESVRQKVFEPFFTTKEQGKGTGLGLATSYGIIRQHGGWITCRSQPSEGTTFSIFLPRAEEPAKLSEPAAKPKKGLSSVEDHHHGRILIVDDEALVRSVAEGILTKAGHKLTTASDGEEALEILKNAKVPFDLVILDLTMPKLSGQETFMEIRRRGLDTPVMICSGYLVDLDSFEEEVGSRPNAFVQKPYPVDELDRVVGELIDSHH